MKKLFLFLSALSVFTFVSCSEEDGSGPSVGVEAVQFVRTAANFPVYDDFASSYVDVEVGVTTKSSSDRTFTVSVDTENSTATSAQYLLESYTVTIPADSYVGTIRVYGYYDQIAPDTEVDLILTLSDTDTRVVTGKSTHTLTMYQACATNPVTLTISFDGYASEITWQLYDSSNNLIAEDPGTYTDGLASYFEEFCLDDDTYTFYVQDVYGDGLSYPSDGSIVFRNATTNAVLGSASGDFGSGTSFSFTLP